MKRLAKRVLSLFGTLWRRTSPRVQPPTPASVDLVPWEHPYLTPANLARFKRYSAAVWDFALEYHRQHPQPFAPAFTVNMAQSMYKWAVLTQEAGFPTAL